jgi:hypothetical protein
LMTQLIMPTPMNAPRQARNALPSSECRTPGAAAINLISSNRDWDDRIYPGIPIRYNPQYYCLAAKSSNELRLT